MVANGLREFPWVPDRLNPALQVAYRIIALAALGASAVALTLVGAGALHRGQVAFIIAFSIGGALFLVVFSRRQYRGPVVVNGEGLLLRTSAQTYTYPWSDVADFVVRQQSSPANARFLRLLCIPDSPFVEVHLRRRSRIGWLGRSGTDVAGIPQIYKRLELRVRDLDDLAAVMSQHAQMRVA
jgi:hypothetical protein